jgi:uncharacterized protein YjbJ (UPF0337 family)
MTMDKNRIDGTAKQVGKLTGDKKVQLEGAAEKQVGKAQTKAGEAADKVRDTLKK